MSEKLVTARLREFLTKKRTLNLWKRNTSESSEVLELKARLGDGEDVDLFLGYRARFNRFGDTKVGQFLRRIFRK